MVGKKDYDKDYEVAKVRQSDNYDQFEVNPDNRAVRRNRKYQLLEASLLKYGWLPKMPAHVVYNPATDKLTIHDGHRRFDIVKRHKIPVSYIVTTEESEPDSTVEMIDIAEEQITTEPWNMTEFLDRYVKRGMADYVMVNAFHEQTGIPVAQCLSILSGRAAGQGMDAKRMLEFKYGKFKVKDLPWAEKVGAFVLFMKNELKCSWGSSRGFVIALTRVLRLPKVDAEKLRQKFLSFESKLRVQHSTEDYVAMIEEIYNRQQTHKIPISFEVGEMLRKLSGSVSIKRRA